MSKWNNEIVKKLNDWCEARCTKYSRLCIEVAENSIKVKRVDGSGRPSILHRFVNNEQIEKFLNTEMECDNFLEVYNRKIAEKMEM